MRLVDADTLMETLGITDMDCTKCKWYSRTKRRCKRGEDFEDACVAIEDALTIEERKKGKWIEENSRPKSSMFYCSVCHRTAYDPQPNRKSGWTKRCRYDFCPNCGADMRGIDKREEL